MLTFNVLSGPRLHYAISGSLNSYDLRHYYKTVRTHYRQFGRLDLSVEVISFSGYGSVSAFLIFLRHEPGLLWKVRSYTLEGGPAWLRSIISGLGTLIPWIQVKLIE